MGCYYCKGKSQVSKPNDIHNHLDCPHRPCYLCKQNGHIAAKCPHRTKPNANASALRALLQNREKKARPFPFIRMRELDSTINPLDPSALFIKSPHFDNKAVYICNALHKKRISSLEWHPSGRHIMSGDKSGVLNIMNLQDAQSQGRFDGSQIPARNCVNSSVHRCNINQLIVDPRDNEILYTSSSDGTVCASRLSLFNTQESETLTESTISRQILADFNPDGFKSPATFNMVYGMAHDHQRSCLYTGTSNGTIRRFDPRSPSSKPDVQGKFHKGKVTSIEVNPIQNDLIATASNDTTVCLWDARKFIMEHELGKYKHSKIVSSAHFSPNTGSKLLTTSMDNKLQLWRNIHAFHGNVNDYPDASPIEMIHSHNFHRYLSPFRAVWDPRDWRDDLFLCGRFLSDAYTDEETGTTQLLHPIDLFSANSASVVHTLLDSCVTLICALNKFSPVSDSIASAPSGSIIIWSQKRTPDGSQLDAGRAGRRADGGDNDDDDGNDDGDNGDTRAKKRLKAVVTKRRSSRRTQTRST